MAKKADLLAEAKELKLSVTEKNTIAEIEAAIKSASEQVSKVASDDKEVVAEREAVVAKAGKRSQKSLDEAEEKAGLSGGTPRTIEGPLYVYGAPESTGFARMDDGAESAHAVTGDPDANLPVRDGLPAL